MLRILGNLLMSISLAVGLIAASTAYLVSLDDAEAVLEQEDADALSLNADAGIKLNEEGQPVAENRNFQPLVPRAGEQGATQLTAETINALRENAKQIQTLRDEPDAQASWAVRNLPDHRYAGLVRVKEFSFQRWPYWWLFVVAAAGMIAGAFLVKVSQRREREALQTRGDTHAEFSPREALERAHNSLLQLQRQMDGTSRSETRDCATITGIVGEVQRQYLAAFVDAREVLIARLGLAGFAQVMDHFAAAERMTNRTWSAAADHHRTEALASLDQAVLRFDETIDLLPRDMPGQSGGLISAMQAADRTQAGALHPAMPPDIPVDDEVTDISSDQDRKADDDREQDESPDRTLRDRPLDDFDI